MKRTIKQMIRAMAALTGKAPLLGHRLRRLAPLGGYAILAALCVATAPSPSLGEDSAFTHGTSAAGRLDLRTGVRIATEGVAERITYSPRWGGAAECTVAVATSETLPEGESGSAALVAAATAEGETTWAPQGAGVYALAHTAGVEMLSALFAVLGENVHGGDLASDEMWTAEKTHLVATAVTVPSGVSLTIEAGAVVKFLPGASLTIASGGSCTAHGVIFTHINDDTVGGDTLCDGAPAVAIPMGDYTITGTVIDDDATEYLYINMPPLELTSNITSDTQLRGYRTYIVSNNVTVASGATLTLQPGTILKFNMGCSLTVNSGATLDAQGTRAAPIVFTSLKDDAHGGDTNGDGDGSIPYPGDWGGVIASGGRIDASYSQFLYGGGVNGNGYGARASCFMWGDANGTFAGCRFSGSPMDGCFAQNATFANCIFDDNDRGLVSSSGNVIADNCVAANNRIGFFSHTSPLVVRNSISSMNTESAITGDGGSRQTLSCYFGEDPRFLDAANGDYRIAADSPCVDAGDAAYAPEKDYYGSPRYAMTYGGEAKPDIGIYEVLPRRVASEVDLEAVEVVVDGDSYAVGDSVTIKWKVRNVGTAMAQGPWTDTISAIDASGAVVTLGSRTTQCNLAPGATVDCAATVRVPAMAEGAARIRLTVNSGRDVFEGTLTANNTVSSSAAFNVAIPVLDVGGGSLIQVPAGSSVAFKLSDVSDAMMLLVSGGANVSVYGASGYVPNFAHSDMEAVRLEGGSLSGMLMLTIPKDATENGFVISIVNDGSSAESVTVATETRSLAIADVSPSRLAVGASGSLRIRGIGLEGVAMTALESSGGARLVATEIKRLTISEMVASFDLFGAAPGTFSVVIEDADGHTDRVGNAVEIYKPSVGPKLEASIEGPSAIRVGRIISARIVYSNVGDMPMRAPYFMLTSDNSKFRLEGEEEWQEGYVEVMGLGSGADPAVLLPGETGSVSYEFISLGGASTRLESDADVSDYWASHADAAAAAANRVNRRGRRVVRYTELERYAKEFSDNPGLANAACGELRDRASGEPLVGIEVCAMSADGELLSSDTVDANGVFVLEGLPNATNIVLSVVEGAFADDMPAVMPDAGDLLGMKWYGTKGWTVNVSVEGATVEDFEDGIEIDVMRLGEDGVTAHLTLTNAVEGVASTIVRESGIYIVRGKTKGGSEQFALIECEAGATVAEAEIDFAQGHVVSGVVSDMNGGGLSGALLSLSPKGEMNGYARTVTSDDNGAFSFGCIEDGEYLLSWTKNGYGSDVPMDVVVSGGDVTGLSLRCMAFDQSIGGRANAECAGMTAAFATPAGGSVTATIAEDGSFMLEGLPVGRGTFSVMDGNGNIICMMRDLYVRPGANTLDVTAETELCNVIGVTVDEAGNPVQAVWLFTSTSGDGGAGYANENGKCLTKLRKATYDVSVAAEGFVTRTFRRKITDSCKLTATLERGGCAKVAVDAEACLVAFSADGIVGDGIEALEDGTVSGSYTNGTEVTAFVVCLDKAYLTDSIAVASGTTGILSRVEGGRALTVTATGNKSDVAAFRFALMDGNGFVATWPISDGKLELSEFPTAPVKVSAIAPDGSIISSVDVAADVTSVSVATSATIPVAGSIVDDMPAMLAGGAVSFGKEGGTILATAEVTPFGTFRADYVSAEYERIWVQLPNGLVFSVSRAEAETANFIITPPDLDETGLSQLQVVDENGDPVEGAEVDIETADGYETTLTTDNRGIVWIVTVVRDEPPKYDPPKTPSDPPKKPPEVKPENPNPTPTTEAKKQLERNGDHDWMCRTCRHYPCNCKVEKEDIDETKKNLQNRCPSCGQMEPCSCKDKGKETEKKEENDKKNPIVEEPVTEPELEELTLDDIPDLDLPQSWDFSGEWYNKYYEKISDLTDRANRLYKQSNPNYRTCLLRNCTRNEQIYSRFNNAKVKTLGMCISANGTLSKLYRKEQIVKGNLVAEVAIGVLSFVPGYGQAAAVGLDVIRNMQSGMTLGQALRSEISSVAGMALSKWQSVRNAEMAALKYWDGMSFRYSRNGLSQKQLLKIYKNDMSNIAKLGKVRNGSLALLDMLPNAQRAFAEIEDLNMEVQVLHKLVLQTELHLLIAEKAAAVPYHKCPGKDDDDDDPPPSPPPPSPRNPHPPYPKPWPEPKSEDPNEVAGPLGVGERRYVNAGDEMIYTVYFENKSDASAAAQDVYITNPLSQWLDWTTFEMRDIGFNNQIDRGLDGRNSGVSEVALKDTPYFVQSSVSLDGSSGLVNVELHIIDKTTKYGVPEDPYAGILPPNDGTHRGEGHFTYRIRVREDAPGNVVITNSASIVFDYNDPIETDPAWWNTVGTLGAAFAESEVAVDEGGTIRVKVSGGSDNAAASVKVYLTYNTAVAADLDLAKGAVDGATPKGGLKFPLTLNWEKGEVGEKVVEIPTKLDKTVEDDEFFTLQLADATGMDVGECRVCTVTVRDPGYAALAAKVADGTATKTELSAWNKLQSAKAPYVRGLADPADGGKVSGSALCAAGKKVTLKATANKEFAFEGWSDGESVVATTATLVIDRTAKPAANTKTSTTIIGLDGDVTYYAVFKSYPKVTVDIGGTGTGKVTGAGKYLPGKKVTLKATADTKDAAATATKPATVKSVFMGWYDGEMLLSREAGYSFTMPSNDVEYVAWFVTAAEDAASIAAAVNGVELRRVADNAPYQTNVWAGVYMEWPVEASALSLPTVKVAGLPSGLKFTAKPVTSKVGSGKAAVTVTNVPANTIYGVPTVASKVNAKTGEVTPSAVKLTVTTAGKSTQTYTVNVVVDALPAWAVGTFDGGGDNGQATLTVSAAGKISGKLLSDGLTWALSAASFTDVEGPLSDVESPSFLATVIGKSGKMAITNALAITAETLGADGARGVGALTGDVSVAVYQNLWKTEPWKTVGKSVANKTFTYKVEDADGNPGELTLKLAANGTVTAKGVFTTGVNEKTGKPIVYTASGTAVLVPTMAPDETGAFAGVAWVYFPPKGAFTGYVECIEVGE